MAGKNDVAKMAGISTGQVEKLFDGILSLVKSDQDVRISGFGTFSKAHREERAGRNPATGEDLTIPAKDVLKFKAAKDIDFTPPKPAGRRRA